ELNLAVGDGYLHEPDPEQRILDRRSSRLGAIDRMRRSGSEFPRQKRSALGLKTIEIIRRDSLHVRIVLPYDEMHPRARMIIIIAAGRMALFQPAGNE